MEFADLMKQRTVFVATGNTYPHREELTSWGWHYDPSRKVWIENNGSSEHDPCIRAIADLPGVVVRKERTNNHA